MLRPVCRVPSRNLRAHHPRFHRGVQRRTVGPEFAIGVEAGFILDVRNSPGVGRRDPRALHHLTVSTVSAGNAGDIVARIVLDQVSKQIGQSFVIENRPGAGGTLATAYVAKADPDGYTRAAADVVAGVLRGDAQVAAVRSGARFRAGGDVRHPAERAGGCAVEGLEVARRPDRHRQGEARRAELRLRGARLGVALARREAAPRGRHQRPAHSVPRPGRGVHRGDDRPRRFLLSADCAGAAQHPRRQGGGARGQHAAAPPALPEVPTVGEAGYPNAQYLFWGGLALPAKTPRAIVDRLHDETEKALRCRRCRSG